jgi:hypothetical protein
MFVKITPPPTPTFRGVVADSEVQEPFRAEAAAAEAFAKRAWEEGDPASSPTSNLWSR